MRAGALARRATASGLWSLAVLSAVVVPVFLEVAQEHRSIWAGNAPGFWARFALPWAGRVWPLLVLPPLVGSAAWGGSLPEGGWRRAAGGALAGALPALLAGLAALPSWIWLARAGAGSIGVVLRGFALGLGVLLTGGVAAGTAAAWLPPAAGAGIGAALGGVLLWWTWAAPA